MSAVTIRFEQRILGRSPGDVEVTEVTPLITALLQQGRVSLVSGKVDLTPPAPQYPEPAVEAPVSPEITKVVVAKGGKGAKGGENGGDTTLTFETEVEAVVAKDAGAE